jgi:diacylglycerol O-acyltransferase / wax synthase
MIDGSSGVDISTILQSVTPDRSIPEAPPYVPRPLPTSFELARDAAARRATLPLRLVSGLRAFRRETDDLRAELGVRARALRDMFAVQLSRASETPINGRIGPHCRFDWHTQPLEELKAIRRAFGCTINDAVLTILTGAFRRYLAHRGVRPEELDFRVQAPVSVRRDDEHGRLGNRVSAWCIRLPLDESEPARQLQAIRKTTRELKESRQALGVDLMMQAMEVMPTALLSLGVRAARGSMNSIVTNVPGPQFPLYLLGRGCWRCIRRFRCCPTWGSASRSSATTDPSAGASTPTRGASPISTSS